MCIDTPPLTDNAIPLSKTDLTKRFVRSPLTIAVITTFGLLPVSGMASQVIKPTGDMAISSSPSTPIDSIVYLDKSQDVVLTATDGTFYLGERQKFCVHGIIGARQSGASNEHEYQTQFS